MTSWITFLFEIDENDNFVAFNSKREIHTSSRVFSKKCEGMTIFFNIEEQRKHYLRISLSLSVLQTQLILSIS